LPITPFPEFVGKLSGPYATLVDAGDKPAQVARVADEVATDITVALLTTVPDPCYYTAFIFQWAVATDLRHLKILVDSRAKAPAIQSMMDLLTDDIGNAAGALQPADC
jgi:hypothetical protein